MTIQNNSLVIFKNEFYSEKHKCLKIYIIIFGSGKTEKSSMTGEAMASGYIWFNGRTPVSSLFACARERNRTQHLLSTPMQIEMSIFNMKTLRNNIVHIRL